MSKKLKDIRGIVFSTDPHFDFKPEEQHETSAPAPSAQLLYLSLERLKGGKVATLVENFIGTDEERQELGKKLKTKCGVGGTVKDGIIQLQGDHRDKVMAMLTDLGYRVKKKGG